MGRHSVNGTQLARHLGRSHSYVSRRLTGEVAFNVSELDTIADLLGVSVTQLIPVDADAA